MQDYFKKDLIKVLVLVGMVVIILAGLTVWDNKTMILSELAGRFF